MISDGEQEERIVDETTYNTYSGDGMLAPFSLVRPPKFVKVLFLLYIFLSYFEIYLSVFIGTSTKYLMLVIMGILLYVYHGKLRINRYWISFFVWFLYWCATILWSSMVNDSVRIHFLSQIGIVLFIVSVGGQTFDEDFIRLNLQGHLWCSTLFGVLSVLLHRSYIDETLASRQVLTLFGRQNDPNNCAAFLLVGVALATYGVIYEKKFIILNLSIIAMNCYATLLTGSRAGLLAIGLLVVVFVFLPSQEKKVDIMGGIKKLFFIAIAVVVVFYVTDRFLPEASLNRLLMFDEYQAGSGRTVKWQGVIHYFYQRPLFGWGWGGTDFRSVGYSDSAHNTFLTLLCEGGIFGFCLFMFPITSLFISAIKTKNALVIILLICGLMPSFFIDAINKRFLWNAIILVIMLTNYYSETGRTVLMWKPKEKE